MNDALYLSGCSGGLCFQVCHPAGPVLVRSNPQRYESQRSRKNEQFQPVPERIASETGPLPVKSAHTVKQRSCVIFIDPFLLCYTVAVTTSRWRWL